MPSLPTGTVTFLFTDIEGSTTLLQRLGDRRYAEILPRKWLVSWCAAGSGSFDRDLVAEALQPQHRVPHHYLLLPFIIVVGPQLLVSDAVP
jgi:hypothetical protein